LEVLEQPAEVNDSSVHPRQLVLFDACQTLVTDLGWATTMPDVLPLRVRQ